MILRSLRRLFRRCKHDYWTVYVMNDRRALVPMNQVCLKCHKIHRRPKALTFTGWERR